MCHVLCWFIILFRLLSITVTFYSKFQAVITPYITKWSRVLPEKVARTQLVKKFPKFLEPEGSLPHFQGPDSCPYPKPDHSKSMLPHSIS